MRLIGLAVVLVLIVASCVTGPHAYRIEPADYLWISVSSNEVMSRSVVVRSDGKISLCVTDGEIAAVKEAEALEQGLPPVWVLWRPALDSTGQRVPDRWFPIRGFDSRAECEAEQRRVITPSLLCLPDTVPGEELHQPRFWVLWRARLDDAFQPIPDQWLLTQGYDSRHLCELSRDWEREFERRSPELWRELERQRERDLERDMERTFGPERWPEVRRDLERKLGREFLRIPPQSLLCLPHTIDPNTPKGK